MQQRFSIRAAAAVLALVAAVLIAHQFFGTLPDRLELGPRTRELRFEPVSFDSAKFAPLRLVGAWTLASDDPRVGGISGLAVDGDELIAATDSGVIIRFAKPNGATVTAEVSELPGGPGDPGFKSNRDSEALARDPAGRGWWVAFESRDWLWLYDNSFTRPARSITIPPRGLSVNVGIEGLAADREGLVLLPEPGGFALRLGQDGWSEIPLDYPARRLSGAAALPDGSLLLIERRLTVIGFANSLVKLNRCESGYCLAWRKRLAVGLLDNVEAIAVEPLVSGGTRLWLATDDNFHRPLRTVLLAADLPPRL